MTTKSRYILPFLYGFDKKDKERVWKIWVVGDTVYKTYGEVDGIHTPSNRVFKGVNVGKKNETTANEQAMREAERDWIKQLDKGYRPKSQKGKELEKKVLIAKKNQGGVNVGIDSVMRNRQAPKATSSSKSTKISHTFIKPMKCSIWEYTDKCLKYFDFENGVYIQPKLDGIRCLARIVDGEVSLTTNSGKGMVWLDHIREQVLILLGESYKNVILDGEIYAHNIKGTAYYDEKKKKYIYEEDEEYDLETDARFQVISGAARPTRNEPHVLEKQLCFHVFDIAELDGTKIQDERFELLNEIFESDTYTSGGCPNIEMVETRLIYDQGDVSSYHGEVTDYDYEGVIIRSRDLTYESKRSLKIRKYKEFIDAEFIITGVECDEGVGVENFTWLCKGVVEKDGEECHIEFKAKPKGTVGQRMEWYENSEEYVGKYLTVRYQDPSSDGIPRFPRGIAIRDYE